MSEIRKDETNMELLEKVQIIVSLYKHYLNNSFELFFECAVHGIYLVGESPIHA